jgi:NAD(P)-dependent dehydrogenase (short-subunit alcohol dehydrogenase family)
MYSSSKFALEGFTESLSYELRAGITNTNSAKAAVSTTPANFDGREVYAPYMQKITEITLTRAAQSDISSDSVTEKIWEAVTDEKDILRYFVGKDDAGYLKARYESNSD